MTGAVHELLAGSSSTLRMLVDEIPEMAEVIRAASPRLAQGDEDALADIYVALVRLRLRCESAFEAIETLDRQLEALPDEPDDEPPAVLLLSEAAARAGLSPETLRFQARAGRLRAFKGGRDWLTTPDWLAEYLERYGRKSRARTEG